MLLKVIAKNDYIFSNAVNYDVAHLRQLIATSLLKGCEKVSYGTSLLLFALRYSTMIEIFLVWLFLDCLMQFGTRPGFFVTLTRSRGID